MAEQRFIKTNDPGLNVGKMFKELVLMTVATRMTEYGADKSLLASVMNEVANMTQPPIGYDQNNPAANKDIGKAVMEYLAYRFADGAEPDWHRQLMDGQDKEER